MPDYGRAVFEAQNLLAESGAGKNGTVNLATVLRHLDLRAIYGDDMIEEAVLDPTQETIFVRKDDSPITRKYFSIAHEIGHWVLHTRDRVRPRINFNNGNSYSKEEIIEEQEANAFAAELLMPYDEVERLAMAGYSIEDLMRYFNVSYEFARYRYIFVVGSSY
ncbi:MAG: ImmA/IrrE family metallo-endopeptidase [Campylobacteraceae bacterium]|nr:ImmA/IrrE family metallo-endopeptidase [Campylobacteraceae bacterium]